MSRIIILFLLGSLFLTGCSTSQEVMTADSLETATGETVQDAELVTEGREPSILYVYVCGCVENPGVYSLEEGARICDALELAGGVSKEGKPETLHQAEPLADGQTIYVPSKFEVVDTTSEEDGLVDINKADKAGLMTLPGIGESKAEVILQYREEHGAFQSIEDLMQIPGIKEGVFDKIKDSIKVS